MSVKFGSYYVNKVRNTDEYTSDLLTTCISDQLSADILDFRRTTTLAVKACR